MPESLLMTLLTIGQLTVADHQAAVTKFVQDNPTKISAIEQVLIPLGYVVPVDPLPPSNDRRTIFATTHETGPGTNRGYGSWDKYERADYNSGVASGGVVEGGLNGAPFAKSGRYLLQTRISGYGTNGVRVFVLNEWTSPTTKIPLPPETYSTFWVYVPKMLTGIRWLAIFQWKQISADRAFNEPTLVLEWGGSTTYLRMHNKGLREGAYTTQNLLAFPIGKWVKIEVHAKHHTSAGFFHVCQDGVKILTSGATPVQTMRTNGANKLETSLLNYGEISGQASTIYFDDYSLECPR